MNIQVTNLNISIIESDIQRLFTPFGEIGSITIDRDRRNNRSRGRAFVDMPVEKQGRQAIETLQGTIFAGKAISLNEVESPEEFKNRRSNF